MGQRISRPRHPCKDSFVVDNDESIGKREWMLGPQTGRQEQFWTIKPVPSSINLFTPPPRPPSNKPSQTDEPSIPGPSPSSKPHEDISTCEPEPEVALTQSMEEPFAFPTPPHSIITIDNMPVRYLPLLLPWFTPSAPENPTASSPHSHNEARQEFTNLQLTLMIT
ncbi:hypothetical protein O181_067256 [Austropuccinia psidii MF-1]|uniref:Uncharacterized protein n=1 Tax=Austropuccinia psidii MF-1 TaxID=1389203 RepID=A0A9Q3EZ90_9BASI|nr:hypothetical protein [Austropuccinia psidii MF-1]